MLEPVRHRQTKGAATDMFGLPPPRHTPTLPPDPQRAVVLRAVRARGHRRAHSRQDRRLEEEGDVDGRRAAARVSGTAGKLIIVESEAETVRFIFRRYAELGSVRWLRDEL